MHLAGSQTETLIVLLHSIIPHHAQHIHKLAVEFAYKEEDDTGFDWNVCRIRQSLLCLAALALPNLEHVSFDYIEKAFVPLTGPKGARAHFHNDLWSQVCRIIGPGILDLSLQTPGNYATTGSTTSLATLLLNFPNLRQLEIQPLFDSTAPDSLLVGAIVEMKKLETLSIDGANWVDAKFANAPWNSPIKALTLRDCQYLNLKDFVTLIGKLGQTLEFLDINKRVAQPLKDEPMEGESSPFDLPKLETLILSTYRPSSFLDRFSKCRLQSLTIRYAPEIDYDEWRSFLSAHLATLRMVTIDGTALISEAGRYAIRRTVESKGIEFFSEPYQDEDGFWDDDL
jgi:hypothetical protein